MEPARVSSPQVDLARCSWDKTPTLLALQSPPLLLPTIGNFILSNIARGEKRGRTECKHRIVLVTRGESHAAKVEEEG